MDKPIISYFPNFMDTDSLFAKMTEYGAPWSSDVGSMMDTAYFTMYSGIKSPSSFLRYNSNDGVANTTLISNMLYSLYGTQWNRLWSAFISEYDPLKSYNLSEDVTRTLTDERTQTSTVDYTGKDSTVSKDVSEGTQANSGSETVVSTGTINEDNNSIETRDLAGTTGGTLKSTVSGSENINSDSSLTHGENVDRTDEINKFTFGFNSETAVPTESQNSTSTEGHSGVDKTVGSEDKTNSSERNDTTTGTSSDTGTIDISGGKDTSTSSNDKKDFSSSVTNSGTVDGTSTVDSTSKSTQELNGGTNLTEEIKRNKGGNLGGEAVQDLLKKEFELWRWSFFTQVFEDVDKYLALSVSSCY